MAKFQITENFIISNIGFVIVGYMVDGKFALGDTIIFDNGKEVVEKEISGYSFTRRNNPTQPFLVVLKM